MAHSGESRLTYCHTGVPETPDYELLRKIGQGGYGEVWLARGLTGILRAIKVVWRDRFPTEAPFEREFHGLQEYAAAAQESPEQLAIFHVGRSERGNLFYYVMELADDLQTGRTIRAETYQPKTLRSLQKLRGRIPVREATVIGGNIARSLSLLHARGLVHRDIKPTNIVFVSGVPKIADIGLVAAADSTKTLVGTEGYLSPDCAGEPNGDVFALGKLLYEISTGLDRNEFPRLPSDLSQFPDRKEFFRLNAVILRACEPDVRNRFSNAAEIRDELERLQPESPRPPPPRRRRPLLVACAVGTAGAALVWFALHEFADNARRPETPAPQSAAEADKLLDHVDTLTNSVFTRDSVSAAEAIAKRASELAPDSARAWATRAYCGSCYLLRGWDPSVVRGQEIQAHARKALAIDPENPLAHLALAILANWQKAYAQGETAARRGLAVRPGDPRLWRVLSSSLFGRGELREALATARTAADRFPNDPVVWYDMALLYGRSDNPADMERYLEKALSLQPFQSALVAKITLEIWQKGDLAAARAAYERIPVDERSDDRVVEIGLNLALMARDPAWVRSIAATTASTYFAREQPRGGPKAAWLAAAYHLEGKNAAELSKWGECEAVIRQQRRDVLDRECDHAHLAFALVHLGRPAEAAAEIASLEAQLKEIPNVERSMLVATYHAARGDAAQAVFHLRQVANRWNGVTRHHLRLHPQWDDIRDQPEFQNLLRELDEEAARAGAKP